MQAKLLLLLGGCAHLVDGQDVFLAASDVNLTTVGSIRLHDWQDSFSASLAIEIDGISDSLFDPEHWDSFASAAYDRLSSSMTSGFRIWQDLVQINTVKKTSKGSAIEAIWNFIDVISVGMFPEVKILLNAGFKSADMMGAISAVRTSGSDKKDFKDAAIHYDSTMNNIKGAFTLNQMSFKLEFDTLWKDASSSGKKDLGKKAKAHMRALLMNTQSASKFAIQYMKEFMEEVGGKYATYICDAKDSHWKTCDQSRGCTQRWYFDTKGAVKNSAYMMNTMITLYQEDVALLLKICPFCVFNKDFSMASQFDSNIVTGKRYKYSLITAESSSDCDGKLQALSTGIVSVPTSIGGLRDERYYECPNVFASDSRWCNL